jgi:hypothetical protein
MPVVIVPDSPMTLEVSALMLTKFSMILEILGVIARVCPVTLEIFSLGPVLAAEMTEIPPTVIPVSPVAMKIVPAPPPIPAAILIILSMTPSAIAVIFATIIAKKSLPKFGPAFGSYLTTSQLCLL